MCSGYLGTCFNSITPPTVHNGTLTQISNQAMDSLNELQYIFMQNLFGVSRSFPKPALCWDTATTMMQIRVENAKFSLIHHTQSLDDSSLTDQIYSLAMGGLVCSQNAKI